jgi:hypothetical protein
MNIVLPKCVINGPRTPISAFAKIGRYECCETPSPSSLSDLATDFLNWVTLSAIGAYITGLANLKGSVGLCLIEGAMRVNRMFDSICLRFDRFSRLFSALAGHF